MLLNRCTRVEREVEQQQVSPVCLHRCALLDERYEVLHKGAVLQAAAQVRM
jgi:hypothetical protein